MKMTSPKWEAKEEKKLLKPLMEKRRRERMNRSLARLRVLLLEATQDQRLKNPKVEKAEILQKTIEFLRTQPQPEANSQEDVLLQRYHSGYQECLTQGTRFLRVSPGLCPGQKACGVDRICPCMEQVPPGALVELPCAPLAPSNPSCESQPCYSPDALGGCRPLLGGPAYVLPPPRAACPAGQGLQACASSLAPPPPPPPEGCSRAPQSRLLEGWGSGLSLWRPWP